MPSSRLSLLLLSFALWPLPGTAAAAPAPSPEQQQMLEQLGVGKAASVSYRDETKSPMTAQVFFARLAKGASFEIEKKETGGNTAATLTLQKAAPEQPKLKLKTGGQLPPLQLTRIDGKPLDSQALAGKYTLLNFFFSTCSPCIREVPELNALALAHGDVNMVAITHDPANDAKQFIQDTGFSWPVAADARSFISAAGIRAFPTFVLLDPQGRIVDMTQGFSLQGKDKGKGKMETWLLRHLPAKKA